MRKEWRPCRDYSPHSVAQSGQCYSIPIYQRLFEWEEEHIIILLEDLRRSYEKGEKDYYIGLLTSTYGNELVDGQQRFIMMMLLGAVLKTYYSGWEAFLYSQEGPRLYFSARPADNRILHHLISSPNGAQEAQGERSKMHEAAP